jgi:hypothetical protein
MPNNTQFASIDSDLLTDVQGGCGGKRRRCCGCSTKNVNVVNNYGAAPAPAAPAPAPGGPAVDVSVGYQQQA